MLEISYSRKFVKDIKRLKSNKHYNSEIFKGVVSSLVRGEGLDVKYKDHQLGGKLENCRECHLKFDLLLIYEVSPNEIRLLPVCTHSELFG